MNSCIVSQGSVSVIGDGNCLFRVISHQLYANEDLHIQLRQSLHRYINQHQSEYEVYWIDSTISYSQHLQQLMCLGSWGTQLELQAFSDYLSLPLFFCSPHPQTRAYSWKFVPSIKKNLTSRRGIALLPAVLPAVHCWSHRNRTQHYQGSL